MKKIIHFLLLVFLINPIIILNCSSTHNEEELEREMGTLTLRLERANDRLQGQQIDEERIIVLGLTGDGKSTLINYLAGNTLLYRIPDVLMRRNRNTPRIDLEGEGLLIGHEAKSQTRSISSLVIDGLGRIYDTPGFYGTGSPVDAIVDMYYLNKILKSPGRIKLIFTVPNSALTDGRGERFCAYCKTLQQYLPGNSWENCLRNSILVLTKVRKIRGRDDEQHLQNARSTLCEIKGKSEESARSFLSSFLDGENGRVCLFYTPDRGSRDQEIPNDSRDIIKSAVSRLDWYSVVPRLAGERDIVLSGGVSRATDRCIERACMAQLGQYFNGLNTKLINLRVEENAGEEVLKRALDRAEGFLNTLTVEALHRELLEVQNIGWVNAISSLRPNAYSEQTQIAVDNARGRLEEAKSNVERVIENLRSNKSSKKHNEEVGRMQKQLEATRVAAMNQAPIIIHHHHGGGGFCSIM